ncbi:hypothetical protein [Rhodopirellula sallentina]|nr:hypothetical protein [Rhodopirellula sallentina]
MRLAAWMVVVSIGMVAGEVERASSDDTLVGVDIESDLDLITPVMTDETPAAGRRVRQVAAEYEGTDVFHALYLPRDWQPDKQYPVIVEYTGNRWAPSLSTGRVEDANLGFGLSGGTRYLWVSMPYVETNHRENAEMWWGDRDATVQYCKTNLPRICDAFGGDRERVVLCGFSRGAIACSYIGLADDEIAGWWKGIVTHDHFDGEREWKYPGSDRESALSRLVRLRGRPVLVCSTRASEIRDSYLGAVSTLADFTFLDVPTKQIFDIPEGKVIHPHTDRWMHRPNTYRDVARDWIDGLCSVESSSGVE